VSSASLPPVFDATIGLPRRLVPNRATPLEIPSLNGTLDLASGLKLVGMPHREARLYLALSGEPQTARRAAENARVHRATAYRLIVRLLERGLIVGDGEIPQRFRATPPELLLARLEGFLREEADLCASLAKAYTRWVQTAATGVGTGSTARPAQLLSARGRGRDPTLTEIEGTRQTLDLVLRPINCSISFRTGLLHTLGNLMRRGVRIRMLTDATPPDQRFIAALSREGGDRTRLLLRRHVAPVGAHYYLRDREIAVRLPALGLSGHLPGIALAEHDRDRVQAQVDRFENLWGQASAPFGPARSTRAYAWNQAAAAFRSGFRAPTHPMDPPFPLHASSALTAGAVSSVRIPRV
jgi:Sugar-specific transcriptional regulator TrmB